MKRGLFSLLTIAFLLTVAQAVAAVPITVLVNGQALVLDVAPLIESGRTLLPVRAIAESLGASVSWDSAARRVEINRSEDTLSLLIDSKIAYVNSLPRQLDVPARIVSGRTLVPARFISESLHAEVKWVDSTRTVFITTYEDTAPSSAALAQLETALLQELNQRRANLGRAALTPVTELNQMARAHAAELALAGAFTHVSPRFGDTALRAAARGLPVHFEYLACGLPNTAAMADALLCGEYGARLLAEEAFFCGVGLYKTAAAGNADIYAVAELIEGNGFMQGVRPRRLEAAECTLSGYAVAGAPLTLYQLNEAGDYVSRFGYTFSVDGSSRFSLHLTLPQPGRYAAVVGQDSMILIYE
jgi:uncharacterized protein YkwD